MSATLRLRFLLLNAWGPLPLVCESKGTLPITLERKGYPGDWTKETLPIRFIFWQSKSLLVCHI